jgi:hypothetical protein
MVSLVNKHKNLNYFLVIFVHYYPQLLHQLNNKIINKIKLKFILKQEVIMQKNNQRKKHA